MPGLTGRRLLAAVGLGFFAGLSSGLLGIGGGIIMVPGMTALLAMSQRRAVANSLLAIVPISIVGVAVYYLGSGHPQVDLRLAAVLAVGAVIGAPLGAAVAYRVPERALRVTLGALAILAAVRLLLP
ncbi:MAG TPA: sulfite exporter TauE/SafE family protein [Candidatus Dormibacteraeota bacterium]|nr:sulfite exporter TauE/SafE family protein [Candidatus Dormibacteraeota bacterium]